MLTHYDFNSQFDMKKTGSNRLWAIIITTLLIVIFFYKSLFFGEKQSYKQPRQEQLHITPYTQKYFQEQNITNIYINLKIINEYNQYCHAHNKLCQVLPHQSRIADSIRLKSVQHAGQIQVDKYKLFENLDTLTALQTYRSYPYIFAQLFLTDKEDIDISQKAATIGESGTKYICNKSGCTNYQLPQNLAFTYYYYLQNAEQSSHYYQLAANSPGAPISLLKMPALVMGRGGFHAKSSIMRYEKFIHEENEMLQEDYIKQALTEYTLKLIQNSCQQDLKCFQDKIKISEQIQSNIAMCTKPQTTRKEQINCKLLNYGLDNNFINTNGNLIYPIDENMTYRRRSDIQDRRVILKTDI